MEAATDILLNLGIAGVFIMYLLYQERQNAGRLDKKETEISALRSLIDALQERRIAENREVLQVAHKVAEALNADAKETAGLTSAIDDLRDARRQLPPPGRG